MTIEEISQINAKHYMYLLFPRQELKRIEKKEEKYRVNPVERALESPINRKIDIKESGKTLDFYA